MDTSNGFNGGSSVSGIPSGGGRLAIFYPWEAHHDIEVGVSGQTGVGTDDLFWSAFVVDATLHVTPYLECLGEFVNTWEETSDVGTLDRQGWWAQAAYKLAGLNLDLPVVNSLEAVVRYGGEQLENNGSIREYDLGLTYYVSNTLLVKGSYSFMSGDAYNAETGDRNWPNVFSFQVAYGF